MAFDFARHLIDHLEEIERIPDGSEILFHEKAVAVLPNKLKKQKSVHVTVKRDFEIKKKVA